MVNSMTYASAVRLIVQADFSDGVGCSPNKAGQCLANEYWNEQKNTHKKYTVNTLLNSAHVMSFITLAILNACVILARYSGDLGN